MSTMNEAALDAVAIVREFDGAPLEDRLRAVGIDADAAMTLAHEFWEQSPAEVSSEDFACAFVGGLITGAVLARR